MTPYAQITLAISDEYPGGLEGFSPLSGQLPASVFANAVEDGQTMSQSGYSHSVFVDLMDRDEMLIGEKCICLAQASQILGLAAESLVPLGRQRLAEINDEDAARVARSTGGGDGR